MKKQDVLNHFGGVSKTAQALSINKATVSCWGDSIPKGRAYQIEVMTGGKLKAVFPKSEQPGEQRSYERVASDTKPEHFPVVQRATQANRGEG